MVRHISGKLKNIFTDTMWSIAGLVLMNVAAQLAVYPYWNRVLGTEAYGNIVYLLAIMNIMAISFGTGVNYTRVRQSVDGLTTNKPYNILMIVGSTTSIFVLLLLKAVGLLKVEIPDFILFCILTIITMWRYYADVEYRLHLNYKGFFLYYLVIGGGYLAGILLFTFTGLWPFALLIGEIAGLFLVSVKGSIFKDNKADRDIASDEQYSPIFNMALLLIGTNLLSHLVFNGDRIILQLFSGSAAVTIYYIASLFGKTLTLFTTPLNGVLAGHLAKYKGKLTKKLMNKVTGIAIVTIVVSTVFCVVMSVLILPILYPVDYEAVKQYLVLANMAQLIYFIGNVLQASILLRFTAARNQMIVNVLHCILFVAICIPGAWKLGIEGFCWGLLVVNLMRIGLCVILGYFGVDNDDNRRIA